ncbi:MAG TPA: hypothetical protein VJT80_19540 [Steroidobacteraceae bacterium]|nr:hypothetical protein [Steroidobacteraceae bacterium]
MYHSRSHRFLALLWSVVVGLALTSAALAEGKRSEPAQRDGAHDFDFGFGVWKTHIVRRVHPLTGSQESIELNGTVTSRKVWGGRAWLEEIETDGPNGHWQGLSLFLYNPTARQWTQAFFNSATVAYSPPLVGSFNGGRGELFAPDTFNGRSILVRGVWTDITPDAHRYEESYSADGGATWELVFSASKTRLAAEPPAAATAAAKHDGSHEFDFDLGAWTTHTSRLQRPLTGSTTWAALDGRTIVNAVWGGRANLAEYEAQGPGGHIELLALRLYNPTSRQWSIYFATPGVGTLSIPAVGEFRNGRVDFYDQEPINEKAVLVRFSLWGITQDTARSEQAFSADGGKTWEVNWINEYRRLP